MILYLDTSAVAKAYVDEPQSALVLQAIRSASAVASNVLAFVEMRSALARLTREKILTERKHIVLKAEFEKDWKNYVKVEAGEEVLRIAADYSEIFALRAYDSLHLASAKYLQDGPVPELIFGCFDKKLNRAAQEVGFALLGK